MGWFRSLINDLRNYWNPAHDPYAPVEGQKVCAFPPRQKCSCAWPEEFIRAPKPSVGHPGWYRHDGGECPVKPDTLIGLPCGTYASLDGTGLMIFQAKQVPWHNDQIRNLRDEIQSFCIISHLPDDKQQLIKAKQDAYAKRSART